MDTRGELLTQNRNPQPYLMGRDRFSPETFLKNLEFALKNPKFTLPLFTIVTIAATTINPLGVDPYPFWHDLILGPKVQQVEAYESPPDQIEISSDTQTTSTEDILFKNFSPKERSSMKEKIDQQLKVYKKHDPDRAKRIINNWGTTINAILDLDVSTKDHQYWHKLLSALLYLESGGSEPNETSSAGAVGPAQMIRTTAQAVAKQHGLFNINPENGWTSIRLARFHLADLIEKYGDLGLALTAYYGGEGLVNIKDSQDGEEYFIKIGAGMKHLEEVEASLVQTIG